MKKHFSFFSIHHSSFIIVTVTVAGAVLRFVPIWFGLPYAGARPDEETSLGHAMAILGGDPNPHFFHWPSLTFYLFAGLFRAAAALGTFTGATADLSGAQRLLIGRGCVALAGTATIGALYRIGRRIGGHTVGLVAALFLAVSILHVRESHFAMTDALMTFFAMLALALLLRGVDQQNPRSFMAAGLAAGLACAVDAIFLHLDLLGHTDPHLQLLPNALIPFIIVAMAAVWFRANIR